MIQKIRLQVGDVIKFKGGNALYLIIDIEEIDGSNIYYYKHPSGIVYCKKEFLLQKQTTKVDLNQSQFSTLPSHHKSYPYNIKVLLGIKTQSITSNSMDWICDKKFWKKNKYFFLHLFATHFPFGEGQLLKYQKILPFGTEYLSTDNRSDFNITGLIYNKKIVWTDTLKNVYYQPSNLLYVGESTDVYSRETDFSRYPIKRIDSLKEYRKFEINRALECCSSPEEMDSCSESIEVLCNSLSEKVNESYVFSNIELFEIITKCNLLIASYRHFYRQIMALTEENIENFNLNNFFDDTLEEYNREYNTQFEVS